MSSEIVPAAPGDWIAASTDEGAMISCPRPITATHFKNALYAGAGEKFRLDLIPPEDRTPDHVDFHEKKLNNASASAILEWRNTARGDKGSRDFAWNRTAGPVETKSTSTNLNISLVEFLKSEELQDMTPQEMEEAGIVIDVTPADEDYAKDL
jgi:hypothetical protein